MKRIERIHLLSRSDRLLPLRDFTRGLVSGIGFNKKATDQIVMAINEACMNVIQHAYKNDNDGEIVVEFYKDSAEIKICVLDFAERVDLKTIQSRDLNDVRPGGLGVHIIQEMMDKVEYRHADKSLGDESSDGNVLEMRKRL